MCDGILSVPAQPENISATVYGSSSVILFWTPCENETGPTNYTLVVDGELKQHSGTFEYVKTIIVDGFNTTSVVVSNLSAYTNYTFSVSAETSKGRSDTISLAEPVITDIDVPAPPHNLTASVNSSSSVSLFWIPSEHEAGPTAYNIVIKGELEQHSGFFAYVDTKRIYGFNTYSLLISNLSSYTKYKFSVSAETSKGNSTNISLAEPVRIDVDVPAPPHNLTALVNSSSSVSLFWIPSEHEAGPTAYNIVIKGELEQHSGFFAYVDTKSIYGFNIYSVLISNLFSYTNYTFSVSAETPKGNSTNIMLAEPVRTNIDGALPPRALSVVVVNSTSVTLTWTPSTHQCGPTNYTIFTEEEFHRGSNEFNTTESLIIQGFQNNGLVIRNLHSFRKYKFSITAQTDVGQPSHKVFSEIVQTKESKPPWKAYTEIFSMNPSETREGITSSSVAVVIKPHALLDCTNGKIIIAGLLVAKGNTNAKMLTDMPHNVSSMRNWQGWKEWRWDNTGSYRATPDDWMLSQSCEKRKSSQKQVMIFVIGSGDHCEEKHERFCNGPLESDTTYSVTPVSCTNAGCTVYDAYGPFKTQPKSILTGVVGGISGAVVLIGVVVGVILGRRRGWFVRKYREDVKENPEVEEEEHCVDKCVPRKITDFSKIVENLGKDSGLLFNQEWQELKSLSPKHPTTIATLIVNRRKNRYRNILAYDHTRVKLISTDEEGSDYINANYIPGYSRRREYIASQGPVRETVNDFWQMIWEQNVPIIVQLTGLYENRQEKLEQYWPDEVNEPHSYGNVLVEIVNISTLTKYTFKLLSVSVGSSKRKIKHYFLRNWQDFGTKLNIGDVLDFACCVRSELKSTDKGPVVVHCSAGVGRTGTFISVDYFRQVINNADMDGTLDIFSFVLKMRDCRPLMVQSEKQYIFVHDAVNEMIERRKRRETENEKKNTGELVYQNQFPNEEEHVYVSLDIPEASTT